MVCLQDYILYNIIQLHTQTHGLRVSQTRLLMACCSLYQFSGYSWVFSVRSKIEVKSLQEDINGHKQHGATFNETLQGENSVRIQCRLLIGHRHGRHPRCTLVSLGLNIFLFSKSLGNDNRHSETIGNRQTREHCRL